MASEDQYGSSVFEVGQLSVKEITVEADGKAESSPKPLLVVTPEKAGQYPVVVFLHGYVLHNRDYTQVLKHIASHGYILVAPQLTAIFPSSEVDIDGAAVTTNWVVDGHLSPLLPTNVNLDLSHIALAGHSRGGHAAFSLALGYGLKTVSFSALIGIDPVAGPSKPVQIPPEILTYKPNSFQLDIPTLMIGTGLGGKPKIPLSPACAPDGLNHNEFYKECKPPSYHFVTSKYGHVDMLDDDAIKLYGYLCTNGEEDCRDLMRRTTGGLVVAFLKAFLFGDSGDFTAILKDPGLAPAELDPVEYKK